MNKDLYLAKNNEYLEADFLPNGTGEGPADLEGEPIPDSEVFGTEEIERVTHDFKIK